MASLHIERQVVRVVLVDPAGLVLLLSTRDASNPAFGSSWELPGGGIEDGETYVDAAARELWEETGIRIRPDEVGKAEHGSAMSLTLTEASADISMRSSRSFACHLPFPESTPLGGSVWSIKIIWSTDGGPCMRSSAPTSVSIREAFPKTWVRCWPATRLRSPWRNGDKAHAPGMRAAS